MSDDTPPAVLTRHRVLCRTSWPALVISLVGALVPVDVVQAQGDYSRPVTSAPQPEDIGAGYIVPEVQRPAPRSAAWHVVDVAALVAALALVAAACHRWRRRWVIVAVTIASLAYFGFYRQGCVCPIGAIQNVAVALVDDTVVLPGIVLAFFFLPLVFASALLDSVHPCSFSILLITIAFLFGLQMTRKKILQIGGMYIIGIFASYLLIGLGILKVLHLFNTPHFMGKLGASLLILFGIINLMNRFFPNTPIKLALPSFTKRPMANLMEKASFAAAFGLGALVGICQFPCMGGPYLMVIGLLRDQVTYLSGFNYLLLYNLILILPLIAVLFISADKFLVDRVQMWKRDNIGGVKLWTGVAMIIIGILIFFI